MRLAEDGTAFPAGRAEPPRGAAVEHDPWVGRGVTQALFQMDKIVIAGLEVPRQLAASDAVARRTIRRALLGSCWQVANRQRAAGICQR